MVEPDTEVFQNPVKINVGTKALAHLPFELAAMGAQSPLLITTKRLGKKKAVRKVVDGLKDSGLPLGVYDGLDEHTHLDAVLELAKLFKEGGFDAILALGSGSVMHTAKALNIAVTENTRDLVPFSVTGDRIMGHLGPCVAIPAKWGDGYETTSKAFVENLGFSSLMLMPDLVVVDPDVFEPEAPLEAISGAMVAFTHAVEGFVGVQKNRFVDAYARTAIQTIMQYLIPTLNGERGWKFARSAVAAADTMAGCVFSNVAPGVTHRLSRTVAQKAACPHGICMGILLPYVLDHLSTRSEYFVDSLLLPMAGPETYAITAGELRVGKALTMIQELHFGLYGLSKNQLPMTLEDLGVKSDHLKPMVGSLVGDALKDVGEKALLMILERALKGDPVDPN